MIDCEHSGCNGWALYESQYIEGDAPHNIHVAEVRIVANKNGGVDVTPNGERITSCGKRHLVAERRCNCFYSNSEKAIRNKIVELQNSGREVCGMCAGHFYSDPI